MLISGQGKENRMKKKEKKGDRKPRQTNREKKNRGAESSTVKQNDFYTETNPQKKANRKHNEI